MDTTTVKMLEGKLKSAMVSVEFWKLEHDKHRDRPSHQCYREALVRAFTTAQILDSLHIDGAVEAMVHVEVLLDNVSPPRDN